MVVASTAGREAHKYSVHIGSPSTYFAHDPMEMTQRGSGICGKVHVGTTNAWVTYVRATDLIVYLTQCWRHLVGQGTSNNHAIERHR